MENRTYQSLHNTKSGGILFNVDVASEIDELEAKGVIDAELADYIIDTVYSMVSDCEFVLGELGNKDNLFSLGAFLGMFDVSATLHNISVYYTQLKLFAEDLDYWYKQVERAEKLLAKHSIDNAEYNDFMKEIRDEIKGNTDKLARAT